MTTTAWVLLAVAGVFALVNWYAAEVENRVLVWVAKPATLAALIGVALALDPASSGVRAWFVVALVLSLAGDVFLMLPSEQFEAGLASFLLGHVAYVVGLVMAFDSVPLALVAVVLVVAGGLVVGRAVVAGAGREDPKLVPPVVAYMVVISTMVVAAWGSAVVLALVGATLFFASDSILAWNKFVRPVPHRGVAVMATYHLGQAGLTLALLDLV